MIEEKEKMRNAVYDHLFKMYSKDLLKTKPYLTLTDSKVISATVYQDLIEIFQSGNLTSYYTRLMRGAI